MVNNWLRPHFRPDGGAPFLFYVVFGAVQLDAPLDATKYRSAGVSPGLQLSQYTVAKHPETLAGFRDGYLWEQLGRRDPELAAKVGDATACVVLRGTPADSTSLSYLRDTVGLLMHFLDHGGVGIYDPQMFHWWSPDQWRDRLFHPASPVPTHHVYILTSPEPSGNETWFHTRGMRKFGRPDLSMRQVPPTQHAAVIDLFNRLIAQQALGDVVPEGQPIRMATLPAGLTCHHGGDVDDPDFNNVHLEIVWG